ncbi:TIGR03943 family putative permease subunit [Cohnella terricola]|uniref:TIGR03943 family putative permease subunit n=1 Tax=Cohnella terricola TaxID=1289167 RepID=UPI001647C087|nr:TIGR03943 family protein [Cohnella terricola]
MIRKPLATAVHYLVRAILLAGFAFLIVHLVRSGKLNLYIAERMQFIVKLSALGLYAVAAQQFYSAIRSFFDKEQSGPDCDCDHEMPETWGKSLLLYGWFALPLIIGYAVPDGLLGSSMAAAKGVQFAPQTVVVPKTSPAPNTPAPVVPAPLSPTNAENEKPTDKPDTKENKQPADSTPEQLDVLFPYDNFTESYAAYGKKLVQQDVITVTPQRFIETLTTIDLYREAFIGKTIEISGFVYREKSMGQQQFGVSRFAISCCSADASPYGVMAKFGHAETLETDAWVAVTGELGTTRYNDIDIIQINVRKIAKIDPPEDPYVSPDLDFGLE